jgi:hypothetical protein
LIQKVNPVALTTRAIENMEKIVIAMINGFCIILKIYPYPYKYHSSKCPFIYNVGKKDNKHPFKKYEPQ